MTSVRVVVSLTSSGVRGGKTNISILVGEKNTTQAPKVYEPHSTVRRVLLDRIHWGIHVVIQATQSGSGENWSREKTRIIAI